MRGKAKTKRARTARPFGTLFYPLAALAVIAAVAGLAAAAVFHPPTADVCSTLYQRARQWVTPPKQTHDFVQLKRSHQARMTNAREQHDQRMAERQLQAAALRDEIAHLQRVLAGETSPETETPPPSSTPVPTATPSPTTRPPTATPTSPPAPTVPDKRVESRAQAADQSTDRRMSTKRRER